MMKKIYLLALFCSVFFNAFLQQDPEAKKILDQASEKAKLYKTIQVNFKLIVDDRKEKTSSESEGLIKIKGDKYRLETGQTIVFFDGKTMWTLNQDIKEVVITEPDMEDDDFVSNPAKILTWYSRDFKYRYVQKATINGVEMHEIDLFPNNLDQPYSRIKIFLTVKDLLMQSVKSIGKDGIDYMVQLNNYNTDLEIDDLLFIFDPSKYKKTEVVDMRF